MERARRYFSMACGLIKVPTLLLLMPSPSLPKAVYNLDLVALMAGGRFQEIANRFIEGMERCVETEAANAAPDRRTPTGTPSDPDKPNRSAPGARPGSRQPSGCEDGSDSPGSAVCPRSVLDTVDGPPTKKARQDQDPCSGKDAVGTPGRGGGVRRVRCPSLDVFQREYMETATPVILTGVSFHKCVCTPCAVLAARAHVL